MEFVQVAVTVLSLLSVAQSAPVTDCETLTQTTDIQKEQLLGGWTYRAETTDTPANSALTKMFVKSVRWNIINDSTTNMISGSQNQKVLGSCFTVRTKMTLANNTLTMEQPYPATDVLLRTSCPDCLVLYTKFTLGSSRYTGLQLLSRRNKLSAAELEEFRKQADCLNLPSPLVLDPEEEYCPDPSESPETIDLTDHIYNIGFDGMKQMDEILRSATGMRTIIDMLSQALSTTKQD